MWIFDIFKSKKDNYTKDYKYEKCTNDEWYEKKRENKIADVLGDKERVEDSKRWLDSHQVTVGTDSPTANLSKTMSDDKAEERQWRRLRSLSNMNILLE